MKKNILVSLDANKTDYSFGIALKRGGIGLAVFMAFSILVPLIPGLPKEWEPFVAALPSVLSALLTDYDSFKGMTKMVKESKVEPSLDLISPLKSLTELAEEELNNKEKQD